jgi:hypothetical protein
VIASLNWQLAPVVPAAQCLQLSTAHPDTVEAEALPSRKSPFITDVSWAADSTLAKMATVCGQVTPGKQHHG